MLSTNAVVDLASWGEVMKGIMVSMKDNGQSQRCRWLLSLTLFALAPFLSTSVVQAASSSAASGSPLAGNGHNVTFDGRIYIVRKTEGWFLSVIRPEKVAYAPGGKVQLNEAFSPPVLIQEPVHDENALAICEANPDNTPYSCNDAGSAAAGPYHCYDLAILDSNAKAEQYNGLRHRTVKIWIKDLLQPTATLHKLAWGPEGLVPMAQSNGQDMRGIEPTVTRDGRLLVWQGRDLNNGDIDRLVYSVNDTPCAATGWTQPRDITEMHVDPKVVGTWALGEKQLRASDGTPYPPGHDFHGAYAWLFHEGDALIFTATQMPCISNENPPGCGPRRSGLSVIGYPTNWGLGHIDGELNPSTTDKVRLFFSSPGPNVFEQIPHVGGIDVWPFFGTNTANYADVIFDDSLDGNYAGVWHMNEAINMEGKYDKGKTPDTGGYFNTGTLHGAYFPDANNALFGKGIIFNGTSSWITVDDNATLNPVNGLTVEFWLKPTQKVDCDGNNNYRVLLSKGDVFNGTYSLVLEEGEVFRARFRAGGETRELVSLTPIPVGEWSQIGFTYNAQTGEAHFVTNGVVTTAKTFASGSIEGMPGPLFIGGPGGNKPACPNGHGVFNGIIDELRISRVARDLTAWGKPGNHARYLTQNVPQTIVASEPFEVSFTLRNVGTTGWSPAKLHRLGTQGPQDNTLWGTGRIELPQPVGPGEEITITTTLMAPDTPGEQTMLWRMVQENSEWFGDFTEAVSIQVTSNPNQALCESTGGSWTSGACKCPDGMQFVPALGCETMVEDPSAAICAASGGTWSNGMCSCPNGTAWDEVLGCKEEDPFVADSDDTDIVEQPDADALFDIQGEEDSGPQQSLDSAVNDNGTNAQDTPKATDTSTAKDSESSQDADDAVSNQGSKPVPKDINNPTISNQGGDSGCQASNQVRSLAPLSWYLALLLLGIGRVRRRSIP